jgi:hypothetical protein
VKRINPKTGKQFKRGDTRDIDDLVFGEYKSQVSNVTGHNYEMWRTPDQVNNMLKKSSDWRKENKEYIKTWRKTANVTPKKRAKMLLRRAKGRAVKKQILFSLTLDDVLPKILEGKCQLTNLPFDLTQDCDSWRNPYSPSIDRIDSSLGYTKENTRVVLTSVNITLNEFGENTMLPILKEMVKAIENNAKQKPTTPVPAGSDIQGDADSKRRALLAARLGEDRDDANYHSGTISRQDVDHRAQASSGDSVGLGDKKVGTFVTSYDIQDHWQLHPAYGWIER